MQTPNFVALLAAGMAFGVAATQAPEGGPGAPGWSVTERLAQFAGMQRRQAELLPIVPASAITTVSGRTLTCVELRSMDEVELITDESYCN